MRANDTIPVQFHYEASDCRIYYTFQNYYNMSRLWRDVVIATWDNTTRCVADSRNYSKRTSTERKSPPKAVVDVPTLYDYLDSQYISPLDISLNTSAGLLDVGTKVNLKIYKQCPNDGRCGVGLVCIPKATSCNADNDGQKISVCLSTCTTLQSPYNCTPITSRLSQSTSQRPIGKRAPEPQRGTRPNDHNTSQHPPVSSHLTLPRLASTDTIGKNVYDGYFEPTIKLKTSDYISNALCSV